MLEKDIERKVREILEEGGDLQVDVNQIALNSELKNFGINSIGYLKIIIDIEKKFGIEFEKDELFFDNFRSINNIVERIKSKFQS